MEIGISNLEIRVSALFGGRSYVAVLDGGCRGKVASSLPMYGPEV